MEQIRFRAMGCDMFAAIDSADTAARAALAEVPGWFAAWEQVLSRFRSDSELVMLNCRAGAGWTPVGPVLWAVLEAARQAASESGGLVTPTLLNELERAGYDRDFEALKEYTLPPGMQQEQPAGWRAIGMDIHNHAIWLPHGLRLDLGGIAKGWAADTAVRRLAAYGPALVDAGGDIAISGPCAGGSPWPVGIAGPSGSGELLDLLLLTSGGVATSGRDLRHWRQGSVEKHHIIDPRTGEPAATDLITVTVVAPSTQEAEMAAKTVFILGSSAGSSWLAARPHLAGLLVTENGHAHRTPALDQYCWHAPALEGAYSDG